MAMIIIVGRYVFRYPDGTNVAAVPGMSYDVFFRILTQAQIDVVAYDQR
jgi:hypothetical protein